MKMIRLTTVTAFSLALGLVACKGEQKQQPAAQPTPAPKPAAPAAPAPAPEPAAAGGDLPGGAEANKLFKTRCVVCHGEKGTGDGPGAAALKVKPRNYTDAAWQKSVKDDELKEIIVKGGGGVGKDPGMPANPDLKKKPEIVDGIVKIIRSFAPEGSLEGAGDGDGGAAKAEGEAEGEDEGKEE